jgi:DNA-directed RNA polymerase specialized sigma24 family protein
LRGRYRRAVERVCRAVAGSEREDCEQEVFARVWRKAALFDPARGSAAAWLLTLARRSALNQLAARRPPTPVDQEPVAVRPSRTVSMPSGWRQGYSGCLSGSGR